MELGGTKQALAREIERALVKGSDQTTVLGGDGALARETSNSC